MRMRFMRNHTLALAVSATLLTLFLAIGVTNCAHTVTSDTPKGTAALTADAIVIRVNELQASVIQACGPAMTCQPGSIDTNLARTIVQTCIDLRTTLKSVPSGWQVTVKTAWTQAKPQFSGITNVAIQAGISAVDALIGGL